MDLDVPGTEEGSKHSRRDFLKGTLGGAAALGVGGVLATRAGTISRIAERVAPEVKPAVAKPKKGGTFTLASIGGASSDTLDGNACVNNIDFARAPQLYDCLMEIAADNTPQLALAEEVTSNKDATEWTIRVRQGVEFHNGKELTIEDVLFTFNRIVKNDFSGASGLAYMNLKAAKKLDTYTAKFPMHSGYSILPISLIGDGEMSIVPVGYNPKKPVGTGAFKYKSFSPGVTSTFDRNPNYWRTGEPYFDAVVIDDYSDSTSQVDALESGAADAADQLAIGSVAPLRSSGKVVKIWSGPGWIPFTMRVDQAPFSDVNVRQAFRYIVDRTEMREEVFGGYGIIGNDIFGINQPDYDTALPQRHQDIDLAKSLLKKAGQEKLSVTLVTGDIKTGALELATVLQENASAAGVTVTLDNNPNFFGPEYTKYTFAQDWWSGYPYLRQVGYSMVTGAPWDETHWNKSSYYPKYLKLYDEALKTVDTGPQNDLVHEMMKMDYDYGGYIIPVFNPNMAGQAPNVQGAGSQKTGDPWVDYFFRTLWFS